MQIPNLTDVYRWATSLVERNENEGKTYYFKLVADKDHKLTATEVKSNVEHDLVIYTSELLGYGSTMTIFKGKVSGQLVGVKEAFVEVAIKFPNHYFEHTYKDIPANENAYLRAMIDEHHQEMPKVFPPISPTNWDLSYPYFVAELPYRVSPGESKLLPLFGNMSVPVSVMELIPGDGLKDVLNSDLAILLRGKEPELILKLVKAVQFLHRYGAHGDIKPEQIKLMFSEAGELEGIKLMDFGYPLAGKDSVYRTITPEYCLPQRARQFFTYFGIADYAELDITRRSDVYALLVLIVKIYGRSEVMRQYIPKTVHVINDSHIYDQVKATYQALFKSGTISDPLFSAALEILDELENNANKVKPEQMLEMLASALE